MFFGVDDNRSKQQKITDAKVRVAAALRELATAEAELKAAKSIRTAADAAAEQFDNNVTQA